MQSVELGRFPAGVQPLFAPCDDLFSKFVKAAQHCLLVVTDTFIGEVVGEILDGIRLQRIDEIVELEWPQLQSIFLCLVEVWAVPVKTNREHTDRRRNVNELWDVLNVLLEHVRRLTWKPYQDVPDR